MNSNLPDDAEIGYCRSRLLPLIGLGAAMTLLGAAVGFGLHRFVGCRTGACPIWASPFASTAYGALLGFLLSR